MNSETASSASSEINFSDIIIEKSDISKEKNESAEQKYKLACTIEKNYNDYESKKKIFLYYFQAGLENHKKAQYKLGLYYYIGDKTIDIPQNYSVAFNYFVCSAYQYYANAMYMIALCYKYGNGVECNNLNALNWFNIAAEYGNVLSHYELGIIYYYGNGVTKDIHKAEHHLRQSTYNGDKLSSDLYSIVNKELAENTH